MGWLGVEGVSWKVGEFGILEGDLGRARGCLQGVKENTRRFWGVMLDGGEAA